MGQPPLERGAVQPILMALTVPEILKGAGRDVGPMQALKVYSSLVELFPLKLTARSLKVCLSPTTNYGIVIVC